MSVMRDKLRLRWLRHRAQAKHRSEPYELPYDAWCTVWQSAGVLESDGTLSSKWVMMRIDRSKPWHIANVIVVKRGNHARLNLPNQRRYAEWGYFAGEYVLKPVNSVTTKETPNDSHTEITIKRESDHKR